MKDAQGLAVPGSTVVAVHEPSGSTYEAVTREDGRFSIPGMRVGGPYTVTSSLQGFQPAVTKDVFVNLGVTSDLTLTLRTLAVTEEVTVVAQSDAGVQFGAHGRGDGRSRARRWRRCRRFEPPRIVHRADAPGRRQRVVRGSGQPA